MDEGLLSLRWNDHGLAFFNMLSNIRKDESFCDVTLTCDGYFYPVHKFVLSTCSDFFYQIFEKTPCKHPVIIIANVSRKDLEALLNYMYLGEVSVFRTELKSLVKAAEILKVKGLAEQTENSSGNENKVKRSSWEADQPESKRTKSEDYSSIHTKQKESERPAHVKDSATRAKVLDTEALNDQDAKGSEVTADDSLDSVGELTSAEISDLRRNESSSESNQDLPEVKVEEVFVKEEFSDPWYEDAEVGVGEYQYDTAVAGLTYGPPQAAFQDNGSPWDLATTQLQARESRLSVRATGASRLQGVSDRKAECHSEEQRERYRKYEATRRSRNFVEHWRSEFDWVYYDTNLRVMTCTTCLKYGTKDDKKTRFVSGNSNFKRLALVRHEISQTHRRCEARRTAELALPNSATPTQSR
nr:protein bric-a-brac 2-like isoform X3 [Penaeus vannamei]XP_027216170.1 protein bric-a-brac 2-like isoform X3 [Penaeus vannamei]XP_027216171.1 protein bric-a-brac 2-like isoform X3 [Penaeus vannamei]